jgi:hypothetical protein
MKEGSGEGPREMEQDREKRAAFVRGILKTRKSMGDHALEHIHEIGADLPEECLISLAYEIPVLPQFLYSCYMEVEKFFELIPSEKTVAAYLWHKKVLQLLSYQMGLGNSGEGEEKRWVLKCPIHLFFPKELAAAFPDAKLVW